MVQARFTGCVESCCGRKVSLDEAEKLLLEAAHVVSGRES
jgi:hypothetical protein